MAVSGFSLMVHGGAGTLCKAAEKGHERDCLESIRVVLERGRELLVRKGSALDAVEVCTALLEDDPLFNAGRGSVLNEDGRVEMDAAIMDGRDLRAGAVAGVRNIANPVRLARLVLQQGEHVMLAGEGAMRFALRQGIPSVQDRYFLTPRRIRQFEAARDPELPFPKGRGAEDEELGTVGAVARDLAGNLAAATSTGGTVNKPAGRIGDSPVIGAGVWADNATCAVSCTGVGEDFMRTVLAKTAADFIEMRGLDAGTAAKEAAEYLVRKVNGRGGLILVDRLGRCASRFTTPALIRGWIEEAGEAVCSS